MLRVAAFNSAGLIRTHLFYVCDVISYLGGVMGVASYHAAMDLKNHSDVHHNGSIAPIHTGQDVSAQSVVLFLTTSLYVRCMQCRSGVVRC